MRITWKVRERHDCVCVCVCVCVTLCTLHTNIFENATKYHAKNFTNTELDHSVSWPFNHSVTYQVLMVQ